MALDGAGQHSPFTAALLRHIETRDLEVRAMLTRVRRSVHEATGGRQVPWDNSSLVTDFYVAAGSGRGAATLTQRTLEEAASLGIPLPAGIEGHRLQRGTGHAAGLIGVWSSGTRRFGGIGRHAMLLVLGVDTAGGTAEIIYGQGPPTPRSADQNPAAHWRSVARLQDTTLSWNLRDGARFVLVPLDRDEARLKWQRGENASAVLLRRLE